MKWKRDLIEMRRERLAMPRLQALTGLTRTTADVDLENVLAKNAMFVEKTMIQHRIAISIGKMTMTLQIPPRHPEMGSQSTNLDAFQPLHTCIFLSYVLGRIKAGSLIEMLKGLAAGV